MKEDLNIKGNEYTYMGTCYTGESPLQMQNRGRLRFRVLIIPFFHHSFALQLPTLFSRSPEPSW